MYTQAQYEQRDDRSIEDHIIRLSGVSWDDYEHLLALRGDHSVPRFAYLDGEVEIMSPSRTHEALKSMIGCLVEVYCLARDIPFSTYGSWTLENKVRSRSAEPDECYVFGTADAERPHLVIEVVWTSGRIDKLDIYRKLGVQEVWYWRKGRIQPYRLCGEHYEPNATSEVLPGLDLDLLTRFLDRPTTSAAIQAFRAALKPDSPA